MDTLLKNIEKKEKDFTVKFSELPEFIKHQFEIINSLQKRVNELNKDFEIEMNCKNEVYGFILSRGYFDEYVEYNRNK